MSPFSNKNKTMRVHDRAESSCSRKTEQASASRTQVASNAASCVLVCQKPHTLGMACLPHL